MRAGVGGGGGVCGAVRGGVGRWAGWAGYHGGGGGYHGGGVWEPGTREHIFMVWFLVLGFRK